MVVYFQWSGQSWGTVLESAQYLQCIAGHIDADSSLDLDPDD